MILVVAAVLCCAGCRHILLGETPPYIKERQAQQQTDERQPGQKIKTELKSAKYAAGLSMGYALLSTMGHDVSPNLSSNGKIHAGAHFTYIFPTKVASGMSNQVWRWACEFRLENRGMHLWDRDTDLGTIDMTSFILGVKSVCVPVKDSGWGLHFDLGYGLGLASYAKDSELKSRDLASGIYTKIEVGTGETLVLGGGVDYYFSKSAWISLDFMFTMVGVPAKWYEDGVRDVYIDRFDANGFQLQLGVRYFI